MKFKGEPNMLVTVSHTKPVKRYRFDDKGILEIPTKNTKLCERFKKKFKVVRKAEK